MTWQRLEGGAIDPELTEGVGAKVADPLWFLGRQWQVGEFRGEDAASPVLVDGTAVAAPITTYWVESEGERTLLPRSPDGVPLEALVEHEPIARGPAAVRMQLESGAALLRRLRQAEAPEAFIIALRNRFAFREQLDVTLDPLGAARLALLSRRGIDGRQVAEAVAALPDNLPSLPELSALDGVTATRLAAVIEDWYRREAVMFCDAVPNQPRSWQSDRLEYRFGVSAAVPGGVIELDAPEYPGGRLDWYHFDVRSRPMPTPGAALDGVTLKSLTSLPNPLTFAGAPAARWWEFEDHDVAFGDLAGGPDDLARSVIAAYALVASDDWYVVPCSLPAGSLASIAELRVLDDFGTWTSIPATAVHDAAAGGGRPWRSFELRGDPGPGRAQPPMLFLPPVVASAEQSRPLESVEFRRDELANLAWAIERRVESQAGRAVDREARPAFAATAEHAVEDGDWVYRLSTDVPDHWLPLVPVRIGGSHARVALRRGRIASNAEAGLPRGTILEPQRPFVMHEEEIPVGGIRIERRYQLARGSDGKVNLWVGRQKSPSGEPMRRTPLRFDALTGWSRRR
jgi:hypothetical protein